jgi:hypothetical protein
MTPTPPPSPQSSPNESSQDVAAVWPSLSRLHVIYADLAREFVMDAPAPEGLDGVDELPAPEVVEQLQQWLDQMDDRIQAYQLRQFLQTSSPLDSDGLLVLVQRLLSKPARTDATRDKIDFLLVQYFSQAAPTELDDNAVDLAYVAQGLEPILGAVELKAPVWLNGLDRVLDSARRCRSLDQLLHGGVLEQGRKAKAQAGELFYLPIALAGFTRFGYLMRRVFFRLMLADLNNILDGLGELEEKGVETIDCRRAQFSAQEPIIRLRMICQSWKVMFQAEYSSGQPLRMLVDLRASVDAALDRDAGAGKENKGKHPAAEVAPQAAAAAGASGTLSAGKSTAFSKPPAPASKGKFEAPTETPEFEISVAAPDWDPEAEEQPHAKSKK